MESKYGIMRFTARTMRFMWQYTNTNDMGQQVTATLDEDLYDRVCEEHTDTGKSKSQVVNDRVRSGYNGSDPTLADSIMPIFGQSLFVVGFLLALLGGSITWGGVAVVGVGLIIGAKVDEYSEKHEVPATTALVKVLGA